jgi:hypothetical protein
VPRTVCHASTLEAQPPHAHPAPVGSTPAEWLNKTTARSHRTGSGTRFRWSAGRYPPVGGGVTRRGPLEYLLNAATKPAKHIR